MRIAGYSVGILATIWALIPAVLMARSASPVDGAGMTAPTEGRAILSDLRRSRSIHFTLYRDYEDDAYDQKLIFALEQNFSRLQREFWDFLPPRHREGHVEVVIFSSRERFDEFAAAESGVPHGETGYLSTGADRMAFLRQDEFHKDVTIAVHELVHVFNRWCTPYTPVWLDEGMAQYYSYFAAEEEGNESMPGGVNVAALRMVDAALAAGQLPRIGTLIQMDEAVFYGPGREINFAAAWALVYYLRHGLGPDRDSLFTRMYSRLAQRGDPHRAFTWSYGANMDMLQHFWLAYLERLYEEHREYIEVAVPVDEEEEPGNDAPAEVITPLRP